MAPNNQPVSDTGNIPRGRGRPRGKRQRSPIKLPSGEELVERDLMASILHVAPVSVKRMGLPTIYIGNIPHHPLNESLNIVASRIRRPQQARRRGTR